MHEADALSGARILITGSAGFIGNALVEALADTAVTLTCLSRSPRTPPVRSARVVEVSADVRDAAQWERHLASVDVVFHLAAQTSVYVAAKDPLADLDANVRPLVALVDACRRLGVRPVVVLAGTATQAGLTPELPVDETQPDRPITAYDLHKLQAEQQLELAAREGTVRGTTLRLANVYGPGPSAGAHDRGVLNKMVSLALAGKPLTVYGDGRFIRDYVFIDDVARAFLLAAAAPERVSGRHFVLGSGRGVALVDAVKLAAEAVARVTGRPRVAIEHVPPPSGLSPIETRSFQADTAAFRAATGWEPRVALEEGLERTARHFAGAA